MTLFPYSGYIFHSKHKDTIMCELGASSYLHLISCKFFIKLLPWHHHSSISLIILINSHSVNDAFNFFVKVKYLSKFSLPDKSWTGTWQLELKVWASRSGKHSYYGDIYIWRLKTQDASGHIIYIYIVLEIIPPRSKYEFIKIHMANSFVSYSNQNSMNRKLSSTYVSLWWGLNWSMNFLNKCTN